MKSNLILIKFSLIFYIFLICEINKIYCQSPEYVWAKNSNGISVVQNVKTVIDANDNIYSVGAFAFYPVVFGNVILSPVDDSSTDIFIVKYNPDGIVLWAKSFGSKFNDYVSDCSIDLNGNIYILGTLGGDGMITGSTTLTTYVGEDLLIIKLGSNGNVLWSRNFGGDSDDGGLSCEVNYNNNVIITGWFDGKKMFLGDTEIIKSKNCPTWERSMFFTELEPDADFVYSSEIPHCVFPEGYFNDIGYSLSGSKFFLLGKDYETEEVYFDQLSSIDFDDYGLIKFNPGDDGWVTPLQCVVDGQQNKYITGHFNSGTLTITNKALNSTKVLVKKGDDIDMFIVKVSYDNKILWARNYGDVFLNECSALNQHGGVFLSGVFFKPVVYFDSYELKCDFQSQNLFIVRINNEGIVGWAKNAEAEHINNAEIAIDKSEENLYVTGSYLWNCRFAHTLLDFADNDSYYIAKLGMITNSNNETKDSDIMQVIPNPNQGNFHINLAPGFNAKRIEIVNLMGQIVWSDMVLTSYNGTEIVLSSEIKNGLYIIKLVNEHGKQKIQKLIVNR